MKWITGTEGMRMLMIVGVLATRTLAQTDELPVPGNYWSPWLQQAQVQQAQVQQAEFGQGVDPRLQFVGNRCGNGGGHGHNYNSYRSYSGYRGYSGYGVPGAYQSFYMGIPGGTPYSSSFYGTNPGWMSQRSFYYNAYRPYYPTYRPYSGYGYGNGPGHGHCR